MAWLAVVFFALTMCRLAALSDDSHALAVAERIATGGLAEAIEPDAGPAKQRSPDPRRGMFRATG
jgi:hypothetical protein